MRYRAKILLREDKRAPIRFLLALLLPGHSFVSKGNQELCSPFKTAKDIAICALQNHPDIKRINAEIAVSDSLVEVAGQRPNPELASKTVFGKENGDRNITAEIDILHTVELGGKRSSRINKAYAEKEILQSRSNRTKHAIYIETMSMLYRLRQIKSELATLDEALLTYAEIRKHFNRRPRLNPEQEVSNSIFQIAESDYQIRKSSLESELESAYKTLYIAIGETSMIKPEILPPFKTDWPDVKNEIDGSKQANGPEQMIAQAELKDAEMSHSLAKAESWPDFKIGPSIERQTQGGESFFSYGVSFSFAVPFFHNNGAGRASAAANIDRANNNLAMQRIEDTSRREIYLKKYRNATKALKTALHVKDLEQKHVNVEKLFFRGVVPSSLVLEAHRQMIDLIKLQNEQEIIALQSLLQIYSYDGYLLEGML